MILIPITNSNGVDEKINFITVSNGNFSKIILRLLDKDGSNKYDWKQESKQKGDKTMSKKMSLEICTFYGNDETKMQQRLDELISEIKIKRDALVDSCHSLLTTRSYEGLDEKSSIQLQNVAVTLRYVVGIMDDELRDAVREYENLREAIAFFRVSKKSS